MVDIEEPGALTNYLRTQGHIAPNEDIRIRVLGGGVSNRAVWVERADGTAWVLKQALEKLRVAEDWFSSPERIHREALGIRWLGVVAPPETITPLVFEDEENYILAMGAVPEPHENWKTLLLAGQIDPSLVEQCGALLGAVHSNSRARRAELAVVFDDRSWFESLRLQPYYQTSADRVPEATDFLAQLIADTRNRRLTLVHGDYSPKNILVYRDRLVLLDHEVIHWGDPAFDAGFALTHFLSKAHHLAQHRAAFAQAAGLFWETYRTQVGTADWTDELDTYAVRHTLACMLSRVAGRSPLEYLGADEKAAQRNVVVSLMRDLPETPSELISEFMERIECDAAN